MVPDLWTLTQAFRQTNPNKACGPDWIPPVLCRRFSCDMATLFYPVSLEGLWSHTVEPLGFKGGLLYRIPKPAAPDPAACGFP